MKKKRNYSTLLRLLLQIGFFIFLPGIYIEAFNGVKQIYLSLIHQSFTASMIPELLALLVTVPLTFVLGRFFCGWMCAFGSFSDFIYQISRKISKKKIKINEPTDRWLKSIKYFILAFLMIAVWSLDISFFHSANPWDVFGMLATVGKAPDFSYVLTNLLPGLLIFTAIIIGSAFIERFFCRYFCPMGAIFAIASKLKIAKIEKPSEKCGNCRACTANCAMHIPLYKMDTVNSGECINCMKCVDTCPRGNISFTVAKSKVRPLFASLAAIILLAGLYMAGDLTLNASQTNSVSASVLADVSASANQKYKDGTYEGSGTGFRGATTTVSVTIKNDKITAVDVVSYGDDRKFFERAFDTISQNIIGSQSSDVDAVSGATFSSNGIKEAVKDALSKASI